MPTVDQSVMFNMALAGTTHLCSGGINRDTQSVVSITASISSQLNIRKQKETSLSLSHHQISDIATYSPSATEYL